MPIDFFMPNWADVLTARGIKVPNRTAPQQQTAPADDARLTSIAASARARDSSSAIFTDTTVEDLQSPIYKGELGA